MIQLFYAPTPNCWKISILLEEASLPYQLVPVRMSKGDQHTESFRAVSPNGKIPAIVDTAPLNGDKPITLFESGAILLYLANKAKRFLPQQEEARFQTIQWLFWQVGGFGPMLGQHGHFFLYHSEKIPYAIERFRKETLRLYSVLNQQLAQTGSYISGSEYTIADMACFPWAITHKAQHVDLNDFPNVQRWFATIRARPQVQRGLAAGRDLFIGDRALRLKTETSL